MKSELIYYKKARKYFLQHSLLRAFCVLFCEWKEGTIIANDSHLRGDTMNDIYAYDPDTEEEAGQCMDEVIQIAEESGAEIQFY